MQRKVRRGGGSGKIKRDGPRALGDKNLTKRVFCNALTKCRRAGRTRRGLLERGPPKVNQHSQDEDAKKRRRRGIFKRGTIKDWTDHISGGGVTGGGLVRSDCWETAVQGQPDSYAKSGDGRKIDKAEKLVKIRVERS